MSALPKHITQELLSRLPENASWNDIFYAVCVRVAAEQVLSGGTALTKFPVSAKPTSKLKQPVEKD